jgi:hypothetical protein
MFYKIALRNISKKGDTDIFPFPIENSLFYDKPGESEEILLEMDRNFNTRLSSSKVDTIKTCVPVGYTGFRWATLIEPAWNAFFLAEVLKISEQIEEKRIAVKEKCVFSYRLKYEEENGTLFDLDVNWKAFYKNAGQVTKEFKYVVTLDISDFYNRISHERLKDVLHADVDADGNTVKRIMDLVSRIASGKDPFGLPIGGNAARILAEALLIRTDNFMKSSGIKFCRFVDDYIVFAQSQADAYHVLNNCADYFLREMGLTLQKNKTAIMTSAEFTTHVESVFDEIESANDPARASLLKLNWHVDPYSAAADEDLRDLKKNLDGSELIRLLKSECRKTKINQMFGKQLVSAVQYLDAEDQSEAFGVLSLNYEKLYPIFPVIMRKAYHNLLKCNEETIETFIGSLTKLVFDDSYVIQSDNNASYALRVLSLTKSDQAKQAIIKLHERVTSGSGYSSDLVKMNSIYAMTNLRNSDWLNRRLQDFPNLSTWERRAAVASASFLEENGKAWRDTYRKYCSPMENLLGDWVFEKHSVQSNWKLPL